MLYSSFHHKGNDEPQPAWIISKNNWLSEIKNIVHQCYTKVLHMLLWKKWAYRSIPPPSLDPPQFPHPFFLYLKSDVFNRGKWKWNLKFWEDTRLNYNLTCNIFVMFKLWRSVKLLESFWKTKWKLQWQDSFIPSLWYGSDRTSTKWATIKSRK